MHFPYYLKIVSTLLALFIASSTQRFLKGKEQRGEHHTPQATPSLTYLQSGEDHIDIDFSQDLPCGICILADYIFCVSEKESTSFSRDGQQQNSICCEDSTCSQVSNSTWTCSNAFPDSVSAKQLCKFHKNRCGSPQNLTVSDDMAIDIFDLAPGETCFYNIESTSGLPSLAAMSLDDVSIEFVVRNSQETTRKLSTEASTTSSKDKSVTTTNSIEDLKETLKEKTTTKSSTNKTTSSTTKENGIEQTVTEDLETLINKEKQKTTKPDSKKNKTVDEGKKKNGTSESNTIQKKLEGNKTESLDEIPTDTIMNVELLRKRKDPKKQKNETSKKNNTQTKDDDHKKNDTHKDKDGKNSSDKKGDGKRLLGSNFSHKGNKSIKHNNQSQDWNFTNKPNSDQAKPDDTSNDKDVSTSDVKQDPKNSQDKDSSKQEKTPDSKEDASKDSSRHLKSHQNSSENCSHSVRNESHAKNSNSENHTSQWKDRNRKQKNFHAREGRKSEDEEHVTLFINPASSDETGPVNFYIAVTRKPTANAETENLMLEEKFTQTSFAKALQFAQVTAFAAIAALMLA